MNKITKIEVKEKEQRYIICDESSLLFMLSYAIDEEINKSKVSKQEGDNIYFAIKKQLEPLFVSSERLQKILEGKR